MGVCLTLNLVVEAPTIEQARAKLEELMGAYLVDAIAHQELGACVPRRAPLSFYAEYWALWLRSILRALREPFYTLSETRQVP